MKAPDTPTKTISNRQRKKEEQRQFVIQKSIDPKKSACGFNVDRILNIAKSQSYFHVDFYKWSAAPLRQKLWGMKQAGLLFGGIKKGSHLLYFSSAEKCRAYSYGGSSK